MSDLTRHLEDYAGAIDELRARGYANDLTLESLLESWNWLARQLDSGGYPETLGLDDYVDHLFVREALQAILDSVSEEAARALQSALEASDRSFESLTREAKQPLLWVSAGWWRGRVPRSARGELRADLESRSIW